MDLRVPHLIVVDSGIYTRGGNCDLLAVHVRIHQTKLTVKRFLTSKSFCYLKRNRCVIGNGTKIKLLNYLGS